MKIPKAIRKTLLKHDQITVEGPPEYAGYDAPLTAPWLRKNEIIIELHNK